MKTFAALLFALLTPLAGAAEKFHPAAEPSPTGRYVVTLAAADGSDAASTAAALTAEYGGKLLPLHAQNFSGFALEVDAAAARRLSDDARVASVDEQPFVFTSPAAQAPAAPAPDANVVAAATATPRPPARHAASPSTAAVAPTATPVIGAAASTVASTSPAPGAKSSATRPARTVVRTDAMPNWQSGDYQYDGAGNIVRIGSDYYQYDALSRLVAASVTQGAHSQTFAYDRYGNITNVVTDGATNVQLSLSPSPSTNQVAASLATYDGAGRMTSRNGGTETYQWDAADSMTALHATGRDDWYVYDANDERIATVTGTTTRYTLRGADGKVLREVTDTPGTNTHSLVWNRDYVYRDGSLLAEELPTRTVHYHLDHLGSVRLTSDAFGTQLGHHDYWPFGDTAPGSSADGERMRFTGHEYDLPGNSDEGLNYMHARYESGKWGRFLSVDPVLDSVDPAAPQSWNRYAYALNNPIKYSDPDGKSATLVGGLLGGAIGGGVALLEGKSWRDVGAAAAGGAVAGAMMGSVIDTGGASLPVLLAAGALSGAAGAMTENVVAGRPHTVQDVAIAAASGTAGVMLTVSAGVVIEGVAARNSAKAAVSAYDDVTTGRSVANRSTNVSRGDFAKNLEANGFTKTVSKDGKVTNFQKDGLKYTLRDAAKSTGGPTADVFKNNKLVAKIRLEAQ